MMKRSAIPFLFVIALAGGCALQSNERTLVQGTGPDEMLKLRSGPGLGFNIVLGLPDGTVLNLKDCVTEVGQRWCKVSLADAPQISGYVSADYISER
jgi:uncharacterized protein YraI